MKTLFISLLIGLAAGLLGALLGVGGGVLMVPVFKNLLGKEIHQAIATSMAVIVITSLVATLNNATNSSLIDWRIVLFTGLGAAIASWFGADLMRSLGSRPLTQGFGIFLIAMGAWMIIKK